MRREGSHSDGTLPALRSEERLHANQRFHVPVAVIPALVPRVDPEVEVLRDPAFDSEFHLTHVPRSLDVVFRRIKRGAERLCVVEPINRQVRFHGGPRAVVCEEVVKRRPKPRSHVPVAETFNERPLIVNEGIRPDPHPDHLALKLETRGVLNTGRGHPVFQTKRVASLQTPREPLRVVGVLTRVVA